MQFLKSNSIKFQIKTLNTIPKYNYLVNEIQKFLFFIKQHYT